MANWRISFTTSTIFEDSEDEPAEDYTEDYSVSEISESFTVRRAGRGESGLLVNSASNDDTDVECDWDMVVEPEPSRPEPRAGAGPTQPGRAGTAQPHTNCSTMCAATYARRRRAASTVTPPNLLHSRAVGMNSVSEDTEPEESSCNSAARPTRRKSRFVAPVRAASKPVEGRWKLVGSKRYDDYLAALGTGACTADMVLRADMVLTVREEPDKQWRLSNETLIRAKSVRGYRTNNRKWTENKFKPGEPKPELLDGESTSTGTSSKNYWLLNDVVSSYLYEVRLPFTGRSS